MEKKTVEKDKDYDLSKVFTIFVVNFFFDYEEPSAPLESLDSTHMYRKR